MYQNNLLSQNAFKENSEGKFFIRYKKQITSQFTSACYVREFIITQKSSEYIL